MLYTQHSPRIKFPRILAQPLFLTLPFFCPIISSGYFSYTYFRIAYILYLAAITTCVRLCFPHPGSRNHAQLKKNFPRFTRVGVATETVRMYFLLTQEYKLNFFRDTSAQSLSIYKMCWGIARKRLQSKPPKRWQRGVSGFLCDRIKKFRGISFRGDLRLRDRANPLLLLTLEVLSLISGKQGS